MNYPAGCGSKAVYICQCAHSVAKHFCSVLYMFILERCGAGMVICLERGADLHMAQLMPLPLTVSCWLVLPFWYQLARVVLDKGPLNVCVCACVSNVDLSVLHLVTSYRAARRYAPPIAADLRPCADGSAVRTALVAWPRRCTPRPGGTDRRTDVSRHQLKSHPSIAEV